MIGFFSNNKPAGKIALQCDAGSPMMGRTSDTGVYQMLKVNSDGSLPFAAVTLPPDATTSYNLSPFSYNTGIAGLKAAGVVMGYVDINTAIVDAGLYVVEPWFVTSQNAGGAVDMILVKVGSPLDFYCNTRAIGTDAFTPSIADFSAGAACFWHNVLMNQVGSSQINIAYNNINGNDIMEEKCYLESGLYKLLICVHTAITTTDPTTYAGVKQFAKIG